jgi:redox-sensing transcriptional repressor
VRKISDSTVRRLSLYLNQLRALAARGIELVSSRELAEGSGTTAAKVRKDLSNFGSFGKRGQGYRVDELRDSLEEILGLQRRWRVAVVGAGKIGTALLGYRDLPARGFKIVAAFDTDPEKTGRDIFGIPVHPVDELEARLRDERIGIVILATPPAVAQEIAERAAAAGVEGILSFAASNLETERPVPVRWMDVALELEGLSFLITSGENGETA